MPKTSITINQSCKTVWDFFTTKENWQKWWGGALKKVDPGWENGAFLIWEIGPTSKVGNVVHEEEIRVVSAWVEHVFRFKRLGEKSTSVEIEFNPRGGASFSDGGLAAKKQMTAALDKLKQCVESEK